MLVLVLKRKRFFSRGQFPQRLRKWLLKPFASKGLKTALFDLSFERLRTRNTFTKESVLKINTLFLIRMKNL
jgi:hypothetical protein